MRLEPLKVITVSGPKRTHKGIGDIGNQGPGDQIVYTLALKSVHIGTLWPTLNYFGTWAFRGSKPTILWVCGVTGNERV